MPMDGVSKVCVLGAGTMGSRIALASAVRGGYRVSLYDLSPEVIATAPGRLRQQGEMAVTMERFTPRELADGLARITCTSDPAEAADGADVLSESVPEIVEIKREIHARFDKLLPPAAVMTTNTSSLLVSDIEDVVGRGDRFAALHFHGGLGSLVDIMRGPRTSEETVEFLKEFTRSIGEVPMVMKKEKGGYLFNSLLGGLLGAALRLAAGGYGEPADIDRAYMLVTGNQAGPFVMMDGIGLNVIHDAGQGLTGVSSDVTPEQLTAFLQPYIDRGDLGVKTGKGFYTYPDPAFRRPGFLEGD